MMQQHPLKNVYLPLMKPHHSTFPVIITLVFAALAFTGIWFHEPWRDELQAWQIAISSASFIDLISNCRYEGHPILWHSLLFLVKFIYPKPLAMQVLHVLISISTVWLIARYSPFTRWQKWLLPFGYTLLFEYTLISRCYGLGFLMVMLFCVLHQQNQHFTWKKSLVLCLLANTSVYGLTFALVLSGFNLYHLFLNQSKLTKQVIPPLLLFLLFAFLSAIQIMPEPDNSYQTNLSSFMQADFIKASFLKIGDAYTNLYNFNIYPLWDLQSNFKFSPGASWFFGLITLGCLIVFGKRLTSNKAVLLFYIGATASVFLLNILAERFPPRQTGHYLMVLLAALWLAGNEGNPVKKTASYMLTLLLGTQVIAGLSYYAADVVRPFSNAAQTASFIKKQGLDKFPVTGAGEFTLSPFAELLHKPVYFIERDETGRFIRWDNKRGRPVDSLHVNKALSQLAMAGDTVLLIINTSYKQTIDELITHKQLRATQIAAFTGAMVYDEDYYLYLALNHKH